MSFNKAVFLFVIVCYLNSINILSQNIEKLKKLKAEPYMVLKIKQFDQFIERFNYKKDFFDQPIDSNFIKEFPREEYIKYLFNEGEDKDTSLLNEELISAFIDSICDKEYPIILDRYSADIIAELDCKVKIDNKDQNIKLYLFQEKNPDNSVKWVILKAKGLIGENIIKSKDKFIPPTSHEINFMNLSALINNDKDGYSLTYKDYKTDELTLFLYLVENNRLNFEHVTDITFHILSVPGFICKVKKFNREELNSGWLISELIGRNIKIVDYISEL